MTKYSHEELMEILSEAHAAHTEDAGLHNFLVPASAYCRTLGLREIIDSLVQSQMQLQPGLLVQTMVLDTLSGRSPLYHLKDFVSAIDRELLLGEEVDPHGFSDTNVGRSLDAIAACGTGRILSALGVEAVRRFTLDPATISYDTTSTSVWGSYDVSDEEGPKITYGHSKDLRPDLKQFMTELLCVDTGIPIFGTTLDGNSSDKESNHRILKTISSLMKQHGLGEGAFIYIADSAMVTSKNLAVLGDTRFISRLPANFKVCESVIDEAMENGKWIPIGTLNEISSSKKRPAAAYQAVEASVTIEDESYRAVVIHSDALDKRRLKKLEKDFADSEVTLQKALKSIPLRYACETDAQQAALQVQTMKSTYHQVQVDIKTVSVRGRGRPPKNGEAKEMERYELVIRIVPQEDRVAAGKRKAGCFVLLTNVAPETLAAKEILKAYKGQFAVEQNFAFLKDPLLVNDLFLKTPSRIDALGMVLIIALMIYRLMQRMMRRYVEETGKKLPGWKTYQDTDRPTTYMLTWALRGIRIYLIRGQRAFLKPPDDRQLRYLEALGLDENVYLKPGLKCKPIIPGISGAKG